MICWEAHCHLGTGFMSCRAICQGICLRCPFWPTSEGDITMSHSQFDLVCNSIIFVHDVITVKKQINNDLMLLCTWCAFSVIMVMSVFDYDNCCLGFRVLAINLWFITTNDDGDEVWVGFGCYCQFCANLNTVLLLSSWAPLDKFCCGVSHVKCLRNKCAYKHCTIGLQSCKGHGNSLSVLQDGLTHFYQIWGLFSVKGYMKHLS